MNYHHDNFFNNVVLSAANGNDRGAYQRWENDYTARELLADCSQGATVHRCTFFIQTVAQGQNKPGPFVQRIRWSCSDLKPPMLMRAAELFGEGLTVREVAATLRTSRLRIRAIEGWTVIAC
jgi:hypothetical protein